MSGMDMMKIKNVLFLMALRGQRYINISKQDAQNVSLMSSTSTTCRLICEAEMFKTNILDEPVWKYYDDLQARGNV